MPEGLGWDPGAGAEQQHVLCSVQQAERSHVLIIQYSSSLPLAANGKWMDFGNESSGGYSSLKQNLSS